MTNKEKYDIFCQNVYVPIFSQPWWMDATCGAGNWDVYVVEKGGSYVAALPYYQENRNGYKIITKAKNTQNNGIIMSYPEEQKYVTKLGYEEKIINEIIDFIEELGIDKYEQQYHYSFQNWLPFYWRNYQGIVRYTYVIEDTSDIAAVQANYDAKARNYLKKAEKHVHLKPEEISTDEFFEINKMSFERQGKEIPYSLEFVKSIYSACKERNVVKILVAEDENGNIHSVALLVWDEESVYYLLNGTDPQYKDTQANCFLIHEGIKLAGSMGKKFDFEGSVIKAIEKSFRQYGGIRKPYFRIQKTFNNELKLQDSQILGGGV